MSLVSLNAGDHSRYLGSASTLGGLPRAGLVGLWTPAGCDGSLAGNAGCRWYTALWNLLLQSEDLTTTWAETGIGTIDDATHFMFAAQNDAVHQSVPTISGVEYTLYAQVRAVTGNTDLHFYHSGLASASTAQTVTGTLADYATTVTGDGGAVLFGLQDQNAGGFGQIEVTKWAVLPGTHTAAEAAALYQKTTAQQILTNWASPGTNDGERGSAAGADSNDYTITTLSRNELAPGSTEDLTDGAWTAGAGAAIDDADNITFSAQNGVVSQDVTTVAGVTYTLSAKIRAVSGNTDLHFYHNNSATGNSTAQTVTATLTRYEVSVLGRAGGGAVSFGIQDQNAAGFGQIEITEWQVEVTGASGPATTYVNPATGRRIVASFTTDDYATADGVAASFAGEDKPATVLVVFKASSVSGFHTMYSMGVSSAGRAWLFRLDDDNVQFGINDGVFENVQTTETVSAETWTVAVVSYTGTAASIYLDGVITSVDGAALDKNSVALNLATIGAARFNSISGYFEGDIALVAIYSRTLGAAEVAAAYNAIKLWWNYDKRNLLEMNIA